LKRFHTRRVIAVLHLDWRVLCTAFVMVMTERPISNPAAASAMLAELVVRSFGLAAGVGLGILLAAAFFTG